MSALGQFLEFSIYTPDILESLGFYKRLGFTEQQIGDIWSHKYAVVGPRHGRLMSAVAIDADAHGAHVFRGGFGSVSDPDPA